MEVIDPKKRPKPFKSAKTHARLRHDYAFWHQDHLKKTVRNPGNMLPGFQRNKSGSGILEKSKFDSAEIIDDVIRKSYLHPAVRARNGNYVITFDMGHLVGFDGIAKRRTTAVTVVTKASGEVITVHPGTPWSKDQNET
ncbi:MAG: hypothetical protein JAY60_20115 [Candidatus Thiodiazotropha weberae]|nr:hypothetical protein [Candidatus Thiodiazotropha weberae]